MVSPEQVNKALERILASEKFANTPKLGRFLRFTVEKTLAGEGSELKEYLLGTEVFDRGSDFDPRLDPIVRVEARRLRAKLEEYYQGPGGQDATRIVLPKGGYVPVFETPSAPPRSASLRWMLIAGAVLAIAATALFTRNGVASRALVTAVIPQDGDEYSAGLAEAVSVELARSQEIRVVAWPIVMEYLQRHTENDIRASTRELGAAAAIAISVRRDGDRLRITALLMRPDSGTKDWAGEYERGTGDPFAVQRELARTIADEAGRAVSRFR